jgi:hypothetical protein
MNRPAATDTIVSRKRHAAYARWVVDELIPFLRYAFSSQHPYAYDYDTVVKRAFEALGPNYSDISVSTVRPAFLCLFPTRNTKNGVSSVAQPSPLPMKSINSKACFSP